MKSISTHSAKPETYHATSRSVKETYQCGRETAAVVRTPFFGVCFDGMGALSSFAT